MHVNPRSACQPPRSPTAELRPPHVLRQPACSMEGAQHHELVGLKEQTQGQGASSRLATTRKAITTPSWPPHRLHTAG